ncbi:serine hydrolase domain-containing protein [Sutcliffiella rhizosphaerae]|uniref:D-alanyl-D-alanine carboxypeptidase n=1 Tax=Sutcliffiella rhizosphaerae TaxID=2880967 RepID=A0ABM8YSG9_9BACI|nr:serine hydrolase [Sutcliffiella rhizosphaerae]CAG9622760.1 Putative D-alanyl-D-alanine carboxypeptidase [Sutcliffiella rhizosphaerae]
MNTEKIEKIFQQTVKNKYIYECVLYMENGDGDFSYEKGYGGKDIDSPLLMASITKLFTTSCVLALVEQGKISLQDKISKYFTPTVIDNLHVYKGKDYSTTLTISHLLKQTSGLPDIFEEKKGNLKNQVIKDDISISFEENIEKTKGLSTHFSPDLKRKAYYADINFDLLGEILEKLTNQRLGEVFETFIFEPLELQKTYLVEKEADFVPDIFYKAQRICRPNYLRSCRASGGAMSTARELMIFLKAFFGGKLFPSNYINKTEFSRLQASMYPIKYGMGYMHIPLQGISTLYMGKGELMGHSGSTGSFAFYYPLKDLYMVGDVNQISAPSLPIRMVMRLAMNSH